MAGDPPVELRWWSGCPSWRQAIELVRERMRAAGFDPARLEVREVVDRREAEELDFAGSPTVVVAGSDVIDPGDAPRGLTCRVYRLRDGRISALPDPADIDDALTAARRRPYR